jgi:hypothetical protein
MNYYFPNYYTTKAIYFYIGILAFVSILFFNRIISVQWVLTGIISVVAFFAVANLLSLKWVDRNEKYFVKELFLYSVVIRLSWVIISYILYISLTGKPFEFSTADAMGYHRSAEWLSKGSWSAAWEKLVAISGGGVSDAGYPFYLTMLYSLVGSEVLIPRLVKAILSAYMVVLVFRLAQRNFGDDVGRMAGIFAMLMPNLIYYNGLHLKEIEMVFLSIWFLERADSLMRSNVLNIPKLILVILIAAVLFTFRTVLGVTALFSVLTALTLSTKRVSKAANRWFFALWVILVIAYFAGGRIANEVEEVWEGRKINQQNSYEWRSKRQDGNTFARYASSTFLAPAIIIVPLPTMVNVPIQQNQQLLHGGYYVKNVMAFFVFMALFVLVLSKQWRNHLLILSYTVGYLMVIAFSAFAHSERFHLPVLPLLLILAAYGIENITPPMKRLYIPYLVLLSIVIVAWTWFKLAGRGLA